jgi:ComF family protein
MRWKQTLRITSDAARAAWRQVDNAVIPPRCAFCGTRLACGTLHVCAGCVADLPRLEHACVRCAEPLPGLSAAGTCCGACQAKPPPVSVTVAPFLYEFPVDAGLKALKFRRQLFYAPAFAGLLLGALGQLRHEVDALLPVPLHWRRVASRGFNQANELCKPISRHTGLPVIGGVARRRATAAQSGLSASARNRNLRGAFVVRKRILARHVLLVDDVITTGATTRHLALALLQQGVARVSVAAVARAT